MARNNLPGWRPALDAQTHRSFLDLTAFAHAVRLFVQSAETLLQFSLILLFSVSGSLSSLKAQTRTLTVAAASDLLPVQKDLSSAFQKEYKISIRWVPGSSGTLARQIRNGAPYDVFLSANHEFPSELARSGHLRPDSLRTYALGRLGLYSKRSSFKTLPSLAGPGLVHLSIANPLHAPYGALAREALRKAGLWEQLGPKLVFGENVVQAFQLASSGNADAALVSWSLIHDKGGVPVDPKLYTPLRQTGGATSESPAEASRFLDWLVGESAQSILKRYGFSPALRP